jgi:type VI secretion system FHA domain protein
VDPLALFGGPAAPLPGAEPQRDDAPLLNQAFTPPRAEIPAAVELTQVVAPRPAGPAAEASPAASAGMVFSWDQAPPAAPVVAPAPGVPAAPPETPPAPAARVEVSVERVEVPPPPSPQAAQPVTPVGHDLLMEAFLRGLGVPVRLPAGLTPELMEQIGVMLREATQGTLELLTARALTKREVRAEVTMIVSKGNNPLKFSPDVGFALSQLLAPQGRGFMPPQEAMRDAYDDLRAHQFGFMAGMRAALAGVLKRFEPEALEQRVVARSLLDNLLPGSRKARLWDLFAQMYGEISQEAEDDFHALFGREFLRAYEEQVERLQAEREPDR